MVGVLAPITFGREIERSMREIIIPGDFVKDFHFTSERHLMIMIRVLGTDSKKVIDFFQDSEKQIFSLKTTEATEGKEISDQFLLGSMYMDEGPPISVDIDLDQPMARLILDFQKI
jgi:hypothetical protein